MANALITGASRGLGKAIAAALAERGWNLIVTARTAADLDSTASGLSGTTAIHPVAGDIADPEHRQRLTDLCRRLGGLDVLVNNAGTLGPSPLPRLDAVDLEDVAETLAINVVAQLAVYQAVVDHLSQGAAVVNITSDAAVAAYPGWGTYGASKAALDQLSAVLAEERPDLKVYSFDPGDMRTRMHQDAFPGEDISDRPLPEKVAPALLSLLESAPPSGRISASELGVPT